MFAYLDVTIKLTIGLVTIILQINLSGKSNLAPISALDQVQNYVLGGIIGGMIYSTTVSVLQFILVLLIWTILVAILRFLTKNNRIIKQLIDGKPQILIVDGHLQINTILRNGMSANDLMFRLRNENIFNVSEVKRAILEQNGQLTILRKGSNTVKYPIIVDGYLNPEALQSIGHDFKWLENKLTELHCQVEDIYLATYENKSLLVFPY